MAAIFRTELDKLDELAKLLVIKKETTGEQSVLTVSP